MRTAALYGLAETAGTTDERIALIAAAAAVLGALVGGLVTGLVTLRAEARREKFAASDRAERWKREEAEKEAATAAAARLLYAQLFRSRLVLEAIAKVEKPFWSDLATVEVPDLSADERRLLATRMKPDDWLRAELAELSIRHLQKTGSDLGHGPLAEPSKRMTGTTVDLITEALNALAVVGGLGSLDPRYESLISDRGTRDVAS